MNDEKALEYQQVAGLLCMDIDVLAEIAEDPDITLEDLLWQIKDLQEKKDDMITNKESRESRYAAVALITSLGTM